jgi:DNA-binding response OmpR family regulator
MSAPDPIFLLVEDNDDDLFFLRYALQKARIPHTLHVVTDGRKAIEYLSGAGEFSDRTAFPPPTLVFLDLKLPSTSGFDVLTWMRTEPAVSNIPVVVLAGSDEERDKVRALELGARSYLVKPPQGDVLRSLIESFMVPPRPPAAAPPLWPSPRL